MAETKPLGPTEKASLLSGHTTKNPANSSGQDCLDVWALILLKGISRFLFYWLFWQFHLSSSMTQKDSRDNCEDQAGLTLPAVPAN